MYKHNFVEVCLYEVKPDKTDEFENLLERVVKHHREYSGVVDVRYIKRTHRPVNFSEARQAKPAILLTRKPESVRTFYAEIVRSEISS